MGNSGSSEGVVPQDYSALHDTFPGSGFISFKAPRASPKAIAVPLAQEVGGYTSCAHALKLILDLSSKSSWSADNIHEVACAVLDENDCRTSLWDCVRGVGLHGVKSEDGDSQIEPGVLRFQRVKRQHVVTALGHGLPVACIIDPTKMSKVNTRVTAGGAVAACLIGVSSQTMSIRVFSRQPVDAEIPIELLEDESIVSCFWCIKAHKVAVNRCMLEPHDPPAAIPTEN